ncbi:MAG: hypothetical protein JRH11_15470 [Deltaproteobacteria bacterium]|nr:hypothetical protein [Deltaproteobacteria bacterium]
MQRRSIAYAAAGLAALVALGLAYDALVETDEERIEAFADAVTGEVTSEKIAEALTWCDTGRQPVEVYLMGESLLYESDSALADRARQGMSRFMGQDVRALNRNVQVDGDRASLRVRVMNSQLGMVNATFEFRKRDDKWLLSVVRITR